MQCPRCLHIRIKYLKLIQIIYFKRLPGIRQRPRGTKNEEATALAHKKLTP